VSTRDSFIGRLWPGVISAGISVDSGLYSVGNWSYTIGVYYNREMFAEAGLSDPDSAWTWDTLVAYAHRLTKDENGDGVPEVYGIFMGSHFVEVLEMMNGADIRPGALTASVTDASAEAFAMYLSLMQKNVMPDVRRIQALGMQPSQLLESRKVGMLVEAVPHQMLMETLSITWGVAPFPRIPGKPVRYFRSGSGGLSISATTQNPTAAWEALKWIIGSAQVYQPNPVLRDVDFVGGWERRYPQIAESGFREVWNLSLLHDGGDPRFFVRYSSWTSASILERLQPLLDRLWAGGITIDELKAHMPEVNSHVRRDLEDLLKHEGLHAAFRSDIERALKGLDSDTHR
jgi:ABC-type glycerol-3-phosphate transport system substrate-binding protein